MKKTVLSVAAAGIFLLSVSCLWAGNFSGSDDFSGPAIDTAKWNPDIFPGMSWGTFTQLDGRIKIDSDGGGSSQGVLPWRNGAPYNRDWTAYWDVNVPDFSGQTGSNLKIEMGIQIMKNPPEGNHEVGIFLCHGTGDTSFRNFRAEIDVHGNDNEQEESTSSVFASVRVRWDSLLKQIYCDYDENGGGNNWINLASWNIGTGLYDWEMNDLDTFLCLPWGNPHYLIITYEDNVYGDNFVAAGTPPAAPLAIFRPGSGLWALRNITRAYFGESSDLPVYSDYDGDGTKDIAIFRGSSGLWAIRGITRTYFGGNSDEPVPGDYNDDGSSDIAIFRESSGLWAVRGLTRGYFGTTGDIPLQP